MEYFVYIAKLESETESFFKVGVTSNFKKRCYGFRKAGYTPSLIKRSRLMSLDDAFLLETDVQNANRRWQYNPNADFSGKLECFSRIDNTLSV